MTHACPHIYARTLFIHYKGRLKGGDVKEVFYYDKNRDTGIQEIPTRTERLRDFFTDLSTEPPLSESSNLGGLSGKSQGRKCDTSGIHLSEEDLRQGLLAGHP